MKDTDYNDLIELTHINGTFIPSNQKAIDLSSNLRDGMKTYFKNVTARDLKLLNGYFTLLNYIWLRMPDKFKDRVGRDIFYQYLKIKQSEYDVKFEFPDGRQIIEYHSISFAKMSNDRFREFVKEQISVIYNDVIMAWFNDDQANMLIEEIENEYERFFSKL